MSRPRSANPVTLFPFLAVLVCTMGALILLLLITTRKIRDDAVARAAPPSVRAAVPDAVVVVPPRSAVIAAAPPRPVSIPPDPTVQLGPAQSAPVAMVIERPEPASPPVVRRQPTPVDPNVELRATAARLTAERDRRRNASAALLADLTAAQNALKSRETELAQVETKRQEARQEQARLAQTADTLEKQRTGLSGQLAKVKEEIGRTRRQKSAAPSQYAFVPFDRFSGTNRRPVYIEFTGAGIRFIPEGVLLTQADVEGFTAGFNPLLAGAQALVRHWGEKDRGEPSPYVLLIVRPSGVKLYPARQLLANLDTPHGYELLEEDVPLALPEPDPQAVAACRDAVERVLSQRGRLREELARRSNGFGGGLDGDGLGRGGDPFGRGGGGSGRFPDIRRGPGGNGSDRFPEVGRGSGDGLARRPGLGSEFDRGTDPRFGAPHAGTASPHRGGNGMPQIGGPADSEPDGINALRDRPGQHGIGSERGGRDGSEPREPGQLPADIAAQPLGAPGMIAPGSPAASKPNGTGTERRTGPPSTGAQGGPSEKGRADDRVPPSNRAGAAGRPGGSPNGTQGTGSPNAPGSAGPSGGAGLNAGSSGSGGPSSADSNGPAAPPALDLPWYRRPDLIRDDLPRRRRWGHSDPDGTIGFERQITVQVEADRIVIAGQGLPAGQGESREELTQQALTAIERTARTWGHAPRNFYWAPTLKYVVGPGGLPHYRALHGRLDQWGLSSKVEYRSADRDGRR